MVNLVPILFLAPIAYLILRVALGGFWLTLAYHHYRHHDTVTTQKILGLPAHLVTFIIIGSELIIGTLFILGAFTQLAAMASLIFVAKYTVFRHKLQHFPRMSTWFFVCVIAIALFITGAGPLGFDLPI